MRIGAFTVPPNFKTRYDYSGQWMTSILFGIVAMEIYVIISYRNWSVIQEVGMLALYDVERLAVS